MQLSLRPRTSDDLPLGVYVLPVLALIALAAWTVSTGFVDLGTCELKQWFGIPCLSCGATRATLLLLGGDLWGGFAMQPLVVTGYVGLLLWGVAGLITLGSGRAVKVDLTTREKTLLKVAVVVLPLANWIYLVAAGI